jgi:hypothetical protein
VRGDNDSLLSCILVVELDVVTSERGRHRDTGGGRERSDVTASNFIIYPFITLTAVFVWRKRATHHNSS